eukprot:2030897-Amphidinium_carterae.1
MTIQSQLVLSVATQLYTIRGGCGTCKGDVHESMSPTSTVRSCTDRTGIITARLARTMCPVKGH